MGVSSVGKEKERKGRKQATTKVVACFRDAPASFPGFPGVPPLIYPSIEHEEHKPTSLRKERRGSCGLRSMDGFEAGEEANAEEMVMTWGKNNPNINRRVDVGFKLRSNAQTLWPIWTSECTIRIIWIAIIYNTSTISDLEFTVKIRENNHVI
jgi:hypothetical protein